MKIGLKYKNKTFNLEVKKCGFFGTGRGLTFRSRENASALLFNLGRKEFADLTAWFVFFPFMVLWLDDKNKILDMKRVNPWTFRVNSKVPFTKIVEIPLNKKYSKIIALLDES